MKRSSIIAALAAMVLTIAACGSSGGGAGSGTSSPSGGSAGKTTSSSQSGSSASGSSPSTSGSGDQQFADGKTLTIAMSADPGNLDPQMTALSTTLQVDQFLYDTLLTVDAKGKLQPRLAGSWDSTATEATFTLREGITCSDGSPLTASTVADNINFVADPKNASAALGLFVPPGAKATADDDARTVTVTSPSPNPFLVESLGGLFIVCADGVKDRSVLAKGGAGTGMYTLKDSVASDHYTLARRDGYAWGSGDFDAKQQGLPDTVILKIVPNESTAANLLLSGQVDAARIVGPDRDRVSATDPFERDLQSLLGELWFNHASGQPAADQAVRSALTQALDLAQLRAVITGGNGKAPTGMINPGSTPCTGDTVTGNLPAHDVSAATSALEAAGWTGSGTRAKDGKPLAITLYYPSSLGPNMQAGAELMQKSWQAIGADVTIKPMTDTEMSKIILAGQGHWDAALVPVGLPLPTQLVPFVSGAGAPDGQNFSAIDNADYTAAVQKAMQQVGAAGCDQWDAAETALFKAVDVVPFASSTVPWFGKGVTFELTQGEIDPSTVRMSA